MKSFREFFGNLLSSLRYCVMWVLTCIVGFWAVTPKVSYALPVYEKPVDVVYRPSDVHLAAKVDDLSKYRLGFSRSRTSRITYKD